MTNGATAPSPRARSRGPGWLVILAETGLVLICATTTLVGVLATLGCLNEGQLTEPAVCRMPSVESSWYLRGLGTAAAVALVGVVIGHIRRRWWIVLAAVAASLTIAIVVMAWGLRAVPVPRG